MMASGMLANDGEWNVGEMTVEANDGEWNVGKCWRVECWRMMASGMLANDDEWNVGK